MILVVVARLLIWLPCSGIAAESPARVAPWTSSNLKGSPDPPLPYKTERAFSNVKLNRPTDVMWLPDARRWIATQLDGNIVSFKNDSADAIAEPFLNLRDATEQAPRSYAMLFHHDLKRYPWCFVTFSREKRHPQGTHLARLRVVDPKLPRVDAQSLEILLSWNSTGHSGGSMQFGPDGKFYLSVGDGQNPYPPDGLNTGQDLSDFEASILRLDVDRAQGETPYQVPKDNPFVGRPNTREEIWAFGFRNPWKIAFHPKTGDLFAADVGWEMREMIYRVRRGANYGWSIMEGSQPVKPDEQPQIAISPPLFEHTHIDSRSVTGGYVWQSDRLPALKGAYIYGDWMTGKVWALKSEGDQVIWHQELVDTPLQIICFMLDPTGEVLVVGYDGSILRMQPNTTSDDTAQFPRRLSETGLFANVQQQQAAEGVVEYEISAHHWADGTESKQWIGIPGDQRLQVFRRPNWEVGQVKGRFDFPSDTVLAKTVSYRTTSQAPDSSRRLETQILHRLGDEWQAYNYIWNDEQTDAILQDDIATDRKLRIRDSDAPNGLRTQTWHHASRSECLLCHIWSAGSVLGFAPDQLNIEWPRGESQFARLASFGLFDKTLPERTALASPHDTSQPLEARARSYLALNCSSCHRPTGGGTANFNFEITKSLDENNYVNEVPAQGSFGIANARVVAPGAPHRSILLYRTLKSGRGHMPQFGSNVIDRHGVALLRDWIASISASDVGEKSQVERSEPNDSRGDIAMEIGTADRKLAAVVDSLNVAKDLDSRLAVLLDSTESALALSLACNDKAMSSALRNRIVSAGVGREQPQIRDLFEHFLPEDQRVQRLGTTIDERKLLAISGSAERGKRLFEHAKDVNCRQCHRVGNVGQVVGPDLSGIGKQRTPREILVSILRPSEKIDAKYRARKVLTVDGNVLIGIVLKENDNELRLADATGKLHAILAEDIELMQPATKSVMPDQLLSGMRPQQASDLIAFLVAQRKPAPEAEADQNSAEESRDRNNE